MQIPKSEAKDIYLSGDLENKVELPLAILQQNNHKAEDLDADNDADKAEAKDNDLAWAESQYPTPDLSFFEAFLVNLVGLSVENADSFESEGINHSHKKSFVAITAEKRSEYCSLKPAVMTQLEKQQNDRFYDYSQWQIPSKLQTAFVAGTHQQDLPPGLANYYCLKGHPLEKQFCKNRKQHICKHHV